MDRAREQTNRGFYLDPVRIVEGHAKRKTPTTPCITLYRALAEQLDLDRAIFAIKKQHDLIAESGLPRCEEVSSALARIGISLTDLADMRESKKTPSH